MHVPDGFIGGAVSAGAAAAAVAGLTVAVKRAGDEIDEGRAPLTGLVAAFVFAAQMITVPIAAGTSGHLIGGVLAAVLVGPWAAAICLAVVVVVQALFADGGLTALGLNVVNLSLVTTLGGYGIFAALRALLPQRRMLPAAAGIAAGLSVLLASTAFVAEYALGGRGGADPGAVLAAMTGVHALIAAGEAVVTAGAVSALLAVRPDLVHAAGGREPAVVAEGLA
ncbi:MAG TPA: energy-coupling factor ABC transporter permease [Actinomycetota bacterium]|nr:energy-coupling factor ABC transporter permease [Actinomycetota bacterium]